MHGNYRKCTDAFLMENTGEDTTWRIWKVNAKQNFIHLDQCEDE